MKNVTCMSDDASRSLSGQALAPTFLLYHVRKFNFIGAFDVPWQQTAPTQKLTAMSVNSSPQTQLGIVWVASYEPFKFLLRFLMGSSSVRKVLPDHWIAIEFVKRLHVFRLKVAEQKAFGTEDDHGLRLSSL